MINNQLDQITNTVVIKSDSFRSLKETLNRFSGNILFDFEKVIRTPEDLKVVFVGRAFNEKGQLLTEWVEDERGRVKGLTEGFQKHLLNQYGYTNWKDWRLENWGTTWNPKNVKLYQPSNNQLEYSFLTTHPPEGIIEKFNEWCEKNNITLLWTIYYKEDFPRLFSNTKSRLIA